MIMSAWALELVTLWLLWSNSAANLDNNDIQFIQIHGVPSLKGSYIRAEPASFEPQFSESLIQVCGSCWFSVSLCLCLAEPHHDPRLSHGLLPVASCQSRTAQRYTPCQCSACSVSRSAGSPTNVRSPDGPLIACGRPSSAGSPRWLHLYRENHERRGRRCCRYGRVPISRRCAELTGCRSNQIVLSVRPSSVYGHWPCR